MPALPTDEVTCTQEREVFADEKPQQPEPEPSAYNSRFHEHVSSESLPGHYPPDSLD